MRNALLWQLNFPSGVRSYLFGSMHVRDKIAFRLASLAYAFMENCEFYYGEIDQEEAAEKIRPEDFLLQEGQKWTELVGQKAYERMHRHTLRITGLDLDNWQCFHPLIVANKIAELEMNDDEDLALDAYLFKKASDMGMKTGGVEEVDFQLRLLRSLDVKSQLTMLKSLTRRLSRYRAEIEELKKDYENQDILALYKKTRKSLGRLRTPMLKTRNINMAHTILGQADQKAFYTIGAAHLAGAHGVLRILKQNSIDLHPISIG